MRILISTRVFSRVASALALVILFPLDQARSQVAPTLPADGAGLYRAACAACHGGDGRGVDRALVMFEEELPDFSDCSFASREPAADWVGVAHEGGRVRRLSGMMPAFGSALSLEQLERIVTYMKSFCKDKRWPQGELNLPRALFTEKAYPEDEWVLESNNAMSGSASVINTLIYERRFGAKTQIELAVPYGFQRVASTGANDRWVTGVGDVAIGVKRVLTHGLETGHILSAVGEIKLPTGNRAEGFGSGAKVLEGFLSFGKAFPADAFLQLQAGGERPIVRGASSELFWRGAFGKTFTEPNWGRMWTPMLELLGAKESGGTAEWDLVPQMHVTLNQRRHVMVSLGPRIPINERSRPKSFVVSFIWDFFDGGLFDGW